MNEVDQLIATAQQLVGRVLDDKFKLVACIGIGGSGAVFRAEQIALHRTVAVKILNAELATDERLVKRFRDEATSASSLNHPNTVSIIDFGQTRDGLLYLAMEYVSGPTLTQLLQTGVAIAVPRVLDIIAQILAGIEEAHLAGVVHADLKCDNIIVDQRRVGVDMVKVVDFGIARLANAPRDGEERAVCGTPEYMAPEVIRGGVPGYAADLYAIGVILYELIAGVTPFIASSTVEILTNHLKAEVRPLSLHRAELQNLALEQLVAKALAKEPTARFASASEMRTVVLEELARLRGLANLNACSECGVRSETSFKFCPECGAGRQRISRVFDIATPARLVRLNLPICGRDAELENLACYLRGEIQSDGPLVIAGSGGSGKTALLQAGYQRVQADKMFIYQTGADPTLVETPYYPLRAILASLLGLPDICLAGDVEARVAALDLDDRDAPGILHLFGHETGLRELAPAVRRNETIASVRRVMVAAAAQQPMAVVFEDVDRYDSASIDVLQRVVASRDPGLPPIVCTMDPSLATKFTKHPMLLTPLSLDAVAEVVDAAMPELNADRVYKLSRGQPSFVTHLLRFASSGGKLDDAADREADLIAARLAFVPMATLQALQAVAALGTEGAPALIAALMRSDAADASDNHDESAAGLEDAARLGLLRPVPAGPVTDAAELVFESFLVRDIVYASTPADVRRRLHAAAAQAMLNDVQSPALLGHHFLLAGDAQLAIEYLIAAGTEAHAMLDDHGAIRCYRSALLAVRETLGDGDDVAGTFVDISIRLADLLRERGELALAKGFLTEARTWIDRGVMAAAIDRGLAAISAMEGDSETALRLLRRAIGRAIGSGAMTLLCELYVDLATVLMRQGNLDVARQELRECIDMVTMGEGLAATDGPLTLWLVLHLKAQLTQTLGDSYRALRLAEAALVHVTRSHSRVGVARVQAMLADMCERAGLTSQAVQYRTAAVDEMRTLGDRRSTAELLRAELPAQALMAKGILSGLTPMAVAGDPRRLTNTDGWPHGPANARSLPHDNGPVLGNAPTIDVKLA